jgi:hypothetical protein
VKQEPKSALYAKLDEIVQENVEKVEEARIKLQEELRDISIEMNELATQNDKEKLPTLLPVYTSLTRRIVFEALEDKFYVR